MQSVAYSTLSLNLHSISLLSTFPPAGPALHAEVGDTIEVTLKNSLPFPVNMEPGGVTFANPVTVNTGDTYTYR